jgi:hypothetical protein
MDKAVCFPLFLKGSKGFAKMYNRRGKNQASIQPLTTTLPGWRGGEKKNRYDLIDFSVGGRLAVNYCFTGFGNSCTIFQQLFSADKCENSYVLDLSLCFCSVECVTCSIAAERLCQGFSVVLQIGNAIIIYMHSGPIKLAGQLVCIYNH